MIPATPLLREAVGFSHTLQCSVDFYQAGAPVPGWTRAPVTGGTITSDRGNKVRTSCDVTVAVAEWVDLPFDNKAGRFKVQRGVGTLGYTEMLALGEFRIDEITRPSIGEVQIKGSGLEAYIADARFLTPRTPPYGASTVGTIIDMVHEVLPSATFKLRNTTDRRITATATWDRERLDAVVDLASSISAEVFVDGTGSWIITDAPDPLGGAPVFVIDQDVGGVLVERSEDDTRDRVYNAASVSGQSADQNVPPVWAWSADLDPASPTYFYGPFGQKPIFFTSQFFTSTIQCKAYADTLLAQALAANVSLSFKAAPVDFLEVGDLIGVRDRRGQVEALLLQTLRLELGVDAGMDCQTLSSKAVIADGV